MTPSQVLAETSGKFLSKVPSILAATAGDDFLSLSSVPLTFPAGSANGSKVCTTLTATADDLVELDEDFKVLLDQVTYASTLSIGNNVTAVTLIDGNSMLYHPTYKTQLQHTLSFSSCHLCS